MTAHLTERGTTHPGISAWVEDIATMTTPDQIHWCDGSEEEWHRLIDGMVETGTLIRLSESARPNSVYARTNPDDVARVEDSTFICSEKEEDAGFTNNWRDPQEMKAQLSELYKGSMKGRTMYVIPFCMGHVDAEDPKFGIEITDSPYVVISMKIMTRMGSEALKAMEAGNKPFVPGLHSVGMPLADGQADVPWPCSDTKYITHFPETREIWSYGSGYGGNSLLGKKCYALRIASAMAHDEGWLAEHMLIIRLTSPEGKVYHVCAAFPSACGKTNLAMLEPTVPGWKVETVGDDIAWMRFGQDGRLWAVNPENGFFGVAPGTSTKTNPVAMRTLEPGNTIYTNVAVTDHGDIWWEGMSEVPPPHLTDWKGEDWTPDSPKKAAHPNSRFCVPIAQCPSVNQDDFNDPRGVPVDAIIFGGRRKTTVPLVRQARDWNHGVYMGAMCASETTAAAKGEVGVVRFDPMAMLPFIGYNAGDYLQHWINVGKTEGAKMPAVFFVNWFRRDDDGSFLWPGFGENSRVLKWIVERLEGTADAVETPVGHVATPESLDTTGLDIAPEQLAKALAFNKDEWTRELGFVEEWFAKFGDKLPTELAQNLERTKKAVDEA